MSSLAEAADQYPQVRQVLEDRTLTSGRAALEINGLGTATSERSVRRWREANSPQATATAPTTTPNLLGKPEGECETDPNGATFRKVVVSTPILDDDWGPLLEMFGLNPDNYEVLNDTVRMKSWWVARGSVEQDDWQPLQLFSYDARFRKITREPETQEALREVRESLFHPVPLLLQPRIITPYFDCPTTYKFDIADPQIGKKGTVEAVKNWQRGVARHLEAAYELQPTDLHVAYQGDETENVFGHYCVGADEEILTKDLRWERAGDLKVGHELYAFEEDVRDGQGRNYVPSEVTHHEVVDLPAYKMHFSDGRTLVCTPEHPILARTNHPRTFEWMTAAQIKEFIERPRHNQPDAFLPFIQAFAPMRPWYTPNTKMTGYMSAIFDGEGHLSASSPQTQSVTLGFAQKKGKVLDRALATLTAFGFDYAVDDRSTGVQAVRIKGGYGEVLRALGTFQPIRLLDKLPYPRAYGSHAEHPRIISVEDVGLQPIARMSTSSRTYFANGIGSHNSNQGATVELNQSEQEQLDLELRIWTINQMLALGLPVSVSSVISNHGERRAKTGGDPIQGRGDNNSTKIARMAKMHFDLSNPDAPISWHIAPDSTPFVVVEHSGVKAYYSHGYVEQGGGPTVEKKLIDAVEKQILGRPEELNDLRLIFVAHYHHAWTNDQRGRTFFGDPALEAKKSSEWVLDRYGQWSHPGMLGMLVGNHAERGYSHANVF